MLDDWISCANVEWTDELKMCRGFAPISEQDFRESGLCSIFKWHIFEIMFAELGIIVNEKWVIRLRHIMSVRPCMHVHGAESITCCCEEWKIILDWRFRYFLDFLACFRREEKNNIHNCNWILLTVLLFDFDFSNDAEKHYIIFYVARNFLCVYTINASYSTSILHSRRKKMEKLEHGI